MSEKADAEKGQDLLTLCGQGKNRKSSEAKACPLYDNPLDSDDRLRIYDDMGRADIRAKNVKRQHTDTLLSVEHRADDRIKLLLPLAPQ